MTRPGAVDDTYTTLENTALTVTAPGVLANDSDVPSSAIAVQFLSPSHGALTLNTNGSFGYTPDAGFHGTDTFTYCIVDAGVCSNFATVTLTVSPPPPPQAVDDTYTTHQDVSLVIGAPGVLANDVDHSGTGIGVVDETAPASGTAAVANNGSLTYTPNTGFAGTDSFTYTISDDLGAHATATVTVSVTLPPSIVTHASAGVAVGDPISDTATLAGGTAPTGTLTYSLFGPNNTGCSGLAIFTSSTAVAGNGDYSSAPYTTTAAGDYHFTVSYGGDANNAPLTGACGAANETVTVEQTTPTISTTATGPVTYGNATSDSATLAGGVAPSGSLTFDLYGPGATTCTGTPGFTDTRRVAGNGNYASNGFTPTTAGTYYLVAVYSGDTNNTAVTTGCGDEPVTVSPAPQTISFTTTAPSPAQVGATYSPAATATSALPVAITVDAASTGCSLTAGNVHFTAPGTCVIDANQPGDLNHGAALQAQQTAPVTVAPWSPPVCTGTPAPLAGAARGFYLGEHNDTWRLEVTQHSHAPVRFSGTITINAGAFTHVAGVMLEPGDTFTHTARTIQFHFVDYGYIDGITFTTPFNATTISFNLSIDATPAAPDQIHLGTTNGHPAHNPLTIGRLPGC